MLHVTCTLGGWVDFQLFVVKSEIASLTPDLSFCYNLCCKCPNGSCEPVLNIYTSIAFQWYKKLFNVRCFDLCNYSLKVWEFVKTPTPEMGAHLGVWVFILTLSHTSLSPRPCNPFCFGHEPKAKVATKRQQQCNNKHHRGVLQILNPKSMSFKTLKH